MCSDRNFKCFADERRCKFFVSVKSVISKSYNTSEEVVAYAHRFCHRLNYGCCVWELNNNEVQKLSVCFNNAYRTIFGYKIYESVKCLFYFLKLLPLT